MKTLQAGDKAVLDGKEIVQDLIPLKRPRNSYKVYRNDHGWFSKVHQSRLQPVYIVRVLQDGTAREVNPLGEFPHHHGKSLTLQSEEIKAWHEAESQCLTLPIAIIGTYLGQDQPGTLWYARRSSYEFTLIKPITHEK